MADLAHYFEPLTQLRDRRRAPLVLELDLTEGVTDEPPGSPVAQLLARRRQRFTDVIEGLRRAAHDPRVAAVAAKVDGHPIGFAKTQEIRDAVRAFRASGKPAVAWSETLGDFGPGTVGYYLATAFSEIVLGPTGVLGLTGLSSQAYFLRDAVDKIGVEPEVAARHEYKTALNSLTERGYTDAHREASEHLVGVLTGQVDTAIAQARGLTVEKVAELTARGPLLAEEAARAGLVDRLAYRDEVYGELLGRFGPSEGPGAPQLRYVARYNRAKAAERMPSAGRQDHIAMIAVHGAVHGGASRRSPMGGPSTGSDTVAAALRAARRDPSVKAVVLRVDSPGGSHSASDVIRREAELTSRSGTPVVVSMGDVAASGGYYVSLGADRIVAHPGTVTGSIGVFIAKPVNGGLLDKLGIATGSIDGAPHASMFDPSRKFTESEWERVNALLDWIYADFTGRVADARGMGADAVDRVARGRVWTGADAAGSGLVDELGGLETAVRAARDAAGAPALPLRAFPRFDPLQRMRPSESSEEHAAAPQTRLDVWGPLADLSARLGLPAQGALTLPGDWRVR